MGHHLVRPVVAIRLMSRLTINQEQDATGSSTSNGKLSRSHAMSDAEFDAFWLGLKSVLAESDED